MAVAAKDFFEHMDAFMDYRQVVYEVSDQTVKSNMVDLRLFKGFIKRNKHETITGPAVIDFQYYLKKERRNSGRSINRKIFTLRSYAHFIRQQEVAHSKNLPFDDVLKVRQGYRNRPAALTPGQLKSLFNATDRTTCLGLRDYAIYALMYMTGLRVGEVFSLDMDSIDLGKKELRVIGKGKKIRTLHINDELFKVISEYLAVRHFFYDSKKTDALFVSKKGNRLAIRTMEDNFKKLVRKTGLKVRFNITCHTLRHTFASHLNDKGVDMLVIQSLMGHLSSRSTEPYIHPAQEKIREAMEKLPGVIFMNKMLKEGRFFLRFQTNTRKRE
jgi:site-specific recombinase XerD